MTEAFQIALLTAIVNGGITWGIISTKLAWLRRDVDCLHERASACEAKHYSKVSERQKITSGRTS